MILKKDIRQEHPRRYFIAAGAILFLGLAAVYVWTLIFTRFSPYDDEGFLMISVRGWMEGHALYDSVYSPYGPVYFFYEWFLHGLGRLPITHDVTGIFCGVHWVVAAGLLALAAGRISRSAFLGFFVFIRAVAHLTSMANEPGHPQELVVVLLALACLLAASGSEKVSTAAGLGVLAALLVFIKINVGAFYAFALVLASAARTGSMRGSIAAAVAVCLSGVVPFFLMRDHLAEPWAARYAAAMCAGLLAAGIVLGNATRNPDPRIGYYYPAAIGFLVTSLVILGGLLLSGSPMRGMLQTLLIDTSRVPARCCLPLECRQGDWSALAALIAAALFALWSKSSTRMWMAIAGLKSLYAVVGGFLLVTHTGAQLYLLMPWTWLVLVQPGLDAPARSGGFLRAFLCLAAIWQGLQAYPIAGTQLAVGTFLLVLAYALCLADALAYLTGQRFWARRMLARLPQRRLLWEPLALGFALYLFSMHWCPVFQSCRVWAARQPLGLPGTRLVRLPTNEGENFRHITRYLAENCDTFVTFPGFSSLYFWSGKPPLTYFNIAEVLLINNDQQEQVLARLRNTRRALIVINTVTASYVHDSDVLGSGPLASFIRDQCDVITRCGTFRILAPTSNSAEFRE